MVSNWGGSVKPQAKMMRRGVRPEARERCNGVEKARECKSAGRAGVLLVCVLGYNSKFLTPKLLNKKLF